MKCKICNSEIKNSIMTCLKHMHVCSKCCWKCKERVQITSFICKYAKKMNEMKK